MRAIVPFLFVVVLFEGGGYAQPGQTPPVPAPGPAGPPYPAQPGPAQPYPAQPYPAQPYPVQPYSAQPYPGQPYPAQPYPGQPYPYPAVQLTEDEQELLAQGEISDGRYIGGAVTSLFFGLGLGQAVQGRYSDTGKIFTIGELGSFTAVLIGAIGSIDSEGNHDGSTALLTGGLIGYVVFRAWDVVDAFTGPPSQNARLRQLRMRLGLPAYAKVLPYVAPSMSRTGGGTVGVTFRF
jgi:hypothetical protein